jgi:hypothetical protein
LRDNTLTALLQNILLKILTSASLVSLEIKREGKRRKGGSGKRPAGYPPGTGMTFKCGEVNSGRWRGNGAEEVECETSTRVMRCCMIQELVYVSLAVCLI